MMTGLSLVRRDERLHHAAYLIHAADDGVQLALAGEPGSGPSV